MGHAWWHQWGGETVTTVTPAPGEQQPVDNGNAVTIHLDQSPEEVSLVSLNKRLPAGAPARSPKELMEHNFIEYLKRYPKDYGESATDLFTDPRLEGFLKTAQNVVEHNLTPDALPDGFTEAVVVAIGPGSTEPYSSRDVNVKAQSTNINTLFKSFTLTCYDLKAPTTVYVNPRKVAKLDPEALADLPKFHGVWQSGMQMPVLGDVIRARYHRKSFRSGEFMSVVPNQNIAHLLQITDAKEENLATKFAKERFDAMSLDDFKKLSKNEILECAAEYDANYKEIRGPYIDRKGVFQQGTSWRASQESAFNNMDTRMIPYVKCFIWRCWKKEKILIKMNSAYRDLNHQRDLRISWLLKTPGQLQPAPSWSPQEEHMLPMGTNPATVPEGSLISKRPETLIAGPVNGSMHNAALAFDFNPIFPDGTILRGKSAPRSDWFSKGAKVVRIGKQMGLKWGGEFGGNPADPNNTGWDPIHFDMRLILRGAKAPAMAKLFDGDTSGLGEA